MSNDVYGEVGQSACDKLLASTRYPLVLAERRQAFPGCDSLAAEQDGGFYKLTPEEVLDLFKASVIEAGRTNGSTVHDQIFSAAGEILQQAKVMLDASDNDQYEGPSPQDLRAIIDGGIEELPNTLPQFLGDFGIYTWCPYLKLTLKDRPSIKLNSPRIDLDGVALEIAVTGELWWKFPWWNCYKLCLKWKKVTKCKRLASLSVSPDIAIDAHATLSTRGAKVFAEGHFDKLRLDYEILDKIPLEGVANSALKGKDINVYDGAELIASVPALNSKFTIASITLPPKSGAIGVALEVRQI